MLPISLFLLNIALEVLFRIVCQKKRREEEERGGGGRKRRRRSKQASKQEIGPGMMA